MKNVDVIYGTALVFQVNAGTGCMWFNIFDHLAQYIAYNDPVCYVVAGVNGNKAIAWVRVNNG